MAYNRVIKSEEKINPFSIEKMLENPETAKEIRLEYRRLRKIAQKRIKRIGESEFRDSNVYKYNKSGFKAITDTKNNYDIALNFVFLENFLSGKTTVRELRKQKMRTIQTLHDRGYDFVNASNYADFISFMDEMRAKDISNMLPSEQIVDVYSIAEKKGVSSKTLASAFRKYVGDNYRNEERMKQARRKSPGQLWEELESYDLYGNGNPATAKASGGNRGATSQKRKPRK